MSLYLYSASKLLHRIRLAVKSFANFHIHLIRQVHAHGILIQRHCECQQLDPSLLGDSFDTGTLPFSQDAKTTLECCMNGTIESVGDHKVRLVT